MHSSRGHGAAIAVALIVAATPLHALARQAPERDLDHDARRIIASAAMGTSVNGAAPLRLPSDVALERTLDAWRATRRSTDAASGPPLRVSLLDESHFGGCAHRTYAVRTQTGREFWRFTWRDGSRGWRLSELDLRGD